MNPQEWKTQLPYPIHSLYDDYCEGRFSNSFALAHDELYSEIQKIPIDSLTHNERMTMFCRPAVRYCRP